MTLPLKITPSGIGEFEFGSNITSDGGIEYISYLLAKRYVEYLSSSAIQNSYTPGGATQNSLGTRMPGYISPSSWETTTTGIMIDNNYSSREVAKRRDYSGGEDWPIAPKLVNNITRYYLYMSKYNRTKPTFKEHVENVLYDYKLHDDYSYLYLESRSGSTGRPLGLATTSADSFTSMFIEIIDNTIKQIFNQKLPGYYKILPINRSFNNHKLKQMVFRDTVRGSSSIFSRKYNLFLVTDIDNAPTLTTRPLRYDDNGKIQEMDDLGIKNLVNNVLFYEFLARIEEGELSYNISREAIVDFQPARLTGRSRSGIGTADRPTRKTVGTITDRQYPLITSPIRSFRNPLYFARAGQSLATRIETTYKFFINVTKTKYV